MILIASIIVRIVGKASPVLPRSAKFSAAANTGPGSYCRASFRYKWAQAKLGFIHANSTKPRMSITTIGVMILLILD